MWFDDQALRAKEAKDVAVGAPISGAGVGLGAQESLLKCKDEEP